MFSLEARHAHISQQGDAARQAELVLQDRIAFSLTLQQWQDFLPLFSEEVIRHVAVLQQGSVPGERSARFVARLPSQLFLFMMS